MSDKLEALSQPVGYQNKYSGLIHQGTPKYVRYYAANPEIYSPSYSQEYVTALLDENQHLRVRVAEMEAKEEARTKLINDTWDSIPAYQPPKHHGRGA